MSDMYLKNKGSTQTLVRRNNKHYVSQTNWDAEYDGNVANVLLDTNENGLHSYYKFTLDNDDLANMLNVNSVHVPIDQRLQMDFQRNRRPQYRIHDIPEPNRTLQSMQRLMSPASNEEFIIPVPPTNYGKRSRPVSHKVYRIKNIKPHSIKKKRSKRNRYER